MSLSTHIFKKRGPTPAESLQEAKIKKKLSSELSVAIKTLQQENWNTGEPILSTDTANNVCNVLEAVFLHGLKNSVAKKIGKYVGLQNGENVDQSINFWSFASKFTHKDTTAQLTRLGQITTEIGLCRAWIRTALNDGLITSYVDSMLSDKKTLQYFYHRLAYLADFEQQEILKSLLKGLMHLEFKLSYNSRVLNSWTNTPLILAGIIEGDNTPPPVIQSTASDRQKTDQSPSKSKYEGTDSDPVKVISTTKKSGNVNEPKTPPNTPFDVENFAHGFTRQDVENLKKYKLGSSPQETECSSSSHISCPDPVKYNKNPADFLENENKDDVMFTLNEEDVVQEQNCFVSHDIQSLIKHTNEKHEDYSDLKHTNDPDDIESVIRHSHEQEILDSIIMNDNDLNCLSPSPNGADYIPSNSSNEVSPVKFSLEPTEICEKNGVDNNFLQKNEAENTGSPVNDREEHDAKILANILNDNAILSHDTQSNPDQTDSGIVGSPSSSSTSATSSPVPMGVKIKGKKHNLKPDFTARKNESVPEMSPAVANSIETAKLKHSKHRYSLPNIRVFRNSPQSSSLSRPISESGTLDTRAGSESDKDIAGLGSPSSVGNSLGAASGWSSSFNLEAENTVESLPKVTNKNITIGNRPKSESFGSLLQNYTPTSSVTSPTLDDVLQDLPGGSSDMSSHQPRIYEEEDGTVLIESFEIPPSMTDAMSQSKMALLGEIANEKGLDAQNYQCKGCTRPVGLIYGKPRVCTFDAWYYCFECHENDEYYIPSLVVHNWDFRKHPVAKCNHKFLQDVEDQAKLNIAKINPKLYEHVKEMLDIKVVRTQLYYLKTYLFTCKQSIADEFRQSLWPREYFYENIHMYSLSDFLQVPSGALLQSLKKVVKFATKHVYECRLCSQKGYICEFCNRPKVIYPFEVESTIRCKQCKSVFHKTCKIEGKQCPKCNRKQQRKKQMGTEAETPDIQDYAFVPPENNS